MLERIYIEIGNICNLSCSFCQGTFRKERQMTVAEFEEIAEKIKNKAKYIYLHVLGEPLLHKDLSSILEIANNNNLPVCITTNGTLLADKKALLIENYKAIHKVSISLHAPEGNGITEFDNYLKNAVNFAKSAAETGIYVVFRLWNEDSVEGLGQNLQNTQIELFLKENFKNAWQKRPKGFRVDRNIFLEYDGVFTWPSKSEAQEVEQGFCHALSSQAAILVDGTVVPCCLDADGKIPLGNIFESGLEQILNSKRAIDIKQGFASGKIAEPLCKKCTFARKFKKRNN